MNDIFNFNLHIKELITPVMKSLGFKKTNLNFTRNNGRYLEKIMIQKSQFNLSISEKTFFVNYYIYLQDDQSYWISQNRLNAKMKYGFYDSWDFFDETDLIKILTFLAKLLNNYTNNFYSSMEKYLDTFPIITRDIKLSEKIEAKCTEIFNNIQQEIPEEEVLTFDLEKEALLPPKIQISSCSTMLVKQYNLNKFSASILNQGKELHGIKIVISGDAINKNNIQIEKILCSNFYHETLFNVTENEIKDVGEEKYLIFSFNDLIMNPGYNETEIYKLQKKDSFAPLRAYKFHKFDEIEFCFYYKLNNAEGKFQIVFCPNENFEEGQEGSVIELREKEPSYEKIMAKYNINT